MLGLNQMQFRPAKYLLGGTVTFVSLGTIAPAIESGQRDRRTLDRFGSLLNAYG